MDITRLRKGPRMSQIIIHGDMIFMAGQISEDLSGDAAAQTRIILEKIDRYLAEAGSSKSKLLSALIHLNDVADFGSMNGVWDEWVDADNTPARTTVGATLARPGVLVEVTITAAR